VYDDVGAAAVVMHLRCARRGEIVDNVQLPVEIAAYVTLVKTGIVWYSIWRSTDVLPSIMRGVAQDTIDRVRCWGTGCTCWDA
jgi:hypothetical protein